MLLNKRLESKFWKSSLPWIQKIDKKTLNDWRRYSALKFKDELESECQKIKWTDMNNVDQINRELVICTTLVMNKLTPRRVIHLRRPTDLKNYNLEAVKKRRDRLLKKARAKNCPKRL